MTVEPSCSAERVFWVADNGSSHRGQASVDRLERQWANLRLVHLPVHASWLTQIEIYFSVVRRKVVAPNDFTDLAEVEARPAGLPAPRRVDRGPRFDWRFTRSDLDRLRRRLEEHQQLARGRMTTQGSGVVPPMTTSRSRQQKGAIIPQPRSNYQLNHPAGRSEAKPHCYSNRRS